MFGIRSPFYKLKKSAEIVATVTAEAFDGFFNLFTNSSKDLQLVPVYACVRIISQTIATSPLKILQDTKDGRETKTKHKLNKLLKRPMENMTYYNWVQFMGLNLAARGNAFALIVRDVNYEPIELIPLVYSTVSRIELLNSSKYYYQINLNGKTYKLWNEDILDFKVMSDDGVNGLNPIEMHRATLDGASGEIEYNTSFYKQAANISGIIESPKSLDKKAVSEIRDQFTENYGGTANAGKTAVLSDGKVYKQLNLVSPMDANYIESAKLSRADIAVIFGVPLNKLGDLSQATYSNISEMNRDFYTSTMLPYYCAMAQELSLKLLSSDEQDKNVYFEFDAEQLLKLSKKERFDIYSIATDSGIMTRNEVRSLENLKSVDGLDEMLQKSGVMTTEQADSNFKNQTSNTEVKEVSNNKDINDIKSQIGRLNQLVAHLQDNSNKKGDKNEK